MKKKMKQTLSVLLAVCMTVVMLPTGAFAMEAAPAANSGLCAHHAEHTVECGYIEGAEGASCTFVCTECAKETAPALSETQQAFVDAVAALDKDALVALAAAYAADPTEGSEAENAFYEAYNKVEGLEGSAAELYTALTPQQQAEESVAAGKAALDAVISAVKAALAVEVEALAEDTSGGIAITGGQSGTDYTLNEGCLTIESSTPITVSGSEADFRIVVAGGKTANLTLSDATVDMSTSTFAAIDLEDGAKLNLTVSGENTLKGGTKCAGISAPEGTTLSVSGSGTLNVFGGMYGAGIGGGTVTIANAPYENAFYGVHAGTIHISGGTVNATGGNWAAGIGGGAGRERESGEVAGGNGGNITISGGTVNASAGQGGIHPVMGEFGGAAAIGGGGSVGYKRGGAGGTITISGGTVNANSIKSDDNTIGGGAAIGGGYRGNAGSIIISGGTIVAEAGFGAPGIGSGSFCDEGGVIKISDGSVTATGGKCAAGIGAGWTDYYGDANEIVISGGKVSATGGDGVSHPTRGSLGAGAGIGGGYRSEGSNVTISGGIVTATGGSIVGIPDDSWGALTVPSAIGAGSNNTGTHSFSTGQSGSAMINTKTSGTPESGYITDQSNKANWMGIIFEDNSGVVYGSQTANADFVIDAGQTLEIPSAASFTIADGVTVTNNGSIENNGLSRNNGTITGSGTVICNNHNWDEATYDAPKTCAFCKITEGEPLPRVRYGIMEGAAEIYKNDKIYFGTYNNENIKWKVLDADKTNTNEEGMFLLSEYLLVQNNIPFGADVTENEGQTKPNEWQHSDAQDWCKAFAAGSAFTASEKTALKSVSKTDAVTREYDIDWGTSSLADEKVFYLSAEEAATYIGANNRNVGLTATTSGGAAGGWWLRSPHNNDPDAGFVYEDGLVASGIVDSGYPGARPAFNLDSGAVLFSSAASGGKTADGMDTALTAVATTTSTAWKLTLSDSSRSRFTAETTEKNGEVLTVSYTGAITGDNEYISAVVENENGEITYYGRVASVASAAGTAAIDLSGVTMNAADTLYVFNEQHNGDNKTDYASELKAVALTVTPPPATQYQVTKGQNGVWTKGGTGGLDFTVNVEYSKFTTGGSVLVDGAEIASDKYTSQSGSVIITLKAAYLETLSAGQHTLRVNFADGYAETNFTIKAAAAETGGSAQTLNAEAPPTGDNSRLLLWGLLILISAGGIFGVTLMRKKRREENK